MAVTIAETGGHVTETALKSPLSPPVTMRRNDRSHSPKYAFMVLTDMQALACGGLSVYTKFCTPSLQSRQAHSVLVL